MPVSVVSLPQRSSEIPASTRRRGERSAECNPCVTEIHLAVSSTWLPFCLLGRDGFTPSHTYRGLFASPLGKSHFLSSGVKQNGRCVVWSVLSGTSLAGTLHEVLVMAGTGAPLASSTK